MEDYQKRVVAERDDLTVKLSALGAFLKKNAGGNLDPKDEYLLFKQHNIIRQYERVLTSRISRFLETS